MEDMKLFRIILVLSSLIFISNCVGITSQKVDINKVKKERKLPTPVLFKPNAIYVTTGNGEMWNLRHFMSFRFWSPPYFSLTNTENGKIVSWYSKKRDAGGKVRPLFTYGINSGICRDFQVLLYIEKKARHKTFTACKSIGQLDWNFNYWDWAGAEEYLN